MNIQMIDPKKCIPYERNTKIHTKDQITELKRLITEFGFDQPIVVDKDMVIIKGHGRRQAAVELKLKQVPVIVADHLDANQVKLARVVDNDVASAEWDETMLKDVIHNDTAAFTRHGREECKKFWRKFGLCHGDSGRSGN